MSKEACKIFQQRTIQTTFVFYYNLSKNIYKKKNAQQPLKQKWTGLICRSGKFHSAKMGQIFYLSFADVSVGCIDRGCGLSGCSYRGKNRTKC